MIDNQRHLFQLDPNTIYLNGAYMSPQLKSVEDVGIRHLKRKSEPYKITPDHFFSGKEELRKVFAQLISAEDSQRIAIIPSVSFGIATALHNIKFEKGDEVVVLEEQFPSNYYSWKQLETENKIKLRTIVAPTINSERGKQWNKDVLSAINSHTKVVAIPHIHWADGTIFDLIAIRKKCDDVGAYLIIDGTQSVGALPFSVAQIKPDALICGGYKWLMGPYGLGVAYYGEKFDNGLPLDNNWMNHEKSEDFKNLVNYNPNFKPKAVRFDVGQSSNFILVPMLTEGISQILEWGPANIQEYCGAITNEAINRLSSKGYFVESDQQRAKHLFGVYLPKNKDIDALKDRLSEKNIVVSYRGDAVRISPHLYNTKVEIEKLVSCFI
ncbi:MAG: aminotransferase class V-fold PLP-dependent enzyme [Flavobacteriaceae bacterium]|nr:aminotransferase class V-fold PLP-dependent enzyme [Flavobacteriaceae bacterium]